MRLLAAVFLIIIMLTAGAVANANNVDDWKRGVVVVYYSNQYGTGWWVAENTLVTAAHVVKYANGVLVTLIKGDWRGQGQVIYVDKKMDIAVIKTDNMPRDAYLYSISERVVQHDRLYVVGYPYELVELSGSLVDASREPRVAEGFAAWYRPDYKLIEFQATTDAGNSGGPVVYCSGAVAGLVAFAIIGKAGVLYFASDSNAIKNALDQAGVKYNVAQPECQSNNISTKSGLLANVNYEKLVIASSIGLLLSLVSLAVVFVRK